jgi:hypothetical protein
MGSLPANTITLHDLSVPAPAPSAADWNDDGVVILKDAIPGYLMDAYCAEWIAAHTEPTPRYDGERIHLDTYRTLTPGGWPFATPYMHQDALRALVCDGGLGVELERLTGEAMGVHLNLTGWVTTERNWHQDSYLNPAHVGDFYAAVWIALGDIHPDSGPFQYVPGSHRWPQVDQAHIARHYDLTNPMWPKETESILVPLFEQEIAHRAAPIRTYLPKRGDVLIWHGRLLHRGSKAKQAGLERRALIAHYSGIGHRQDMPPAVQHERGGWYFPIEGRQPTA